MRSAACDKPKRVRGVVLTPDALELLQNAVTQSWILGGHEGRPSREQVAEMLNISVQTVHRIFRRDGVDRQSLQLAFAQQSLPWKDAYSIAAHNLRRSLPSPLTELIGR